MRNDIPEIRQYQFLVALEELKSLLRAHVQFGGSNTGQAFASYIDLSGQLVNENSYISPSDLQIIAQHSPGRDPFTSMKSKPSVENIKAASVFICSVKPGEKEFISKLNRAVENGGAVQATARLKDGFDAARQVGLFTQREIEEIMEKSALRFIRKRLKEAREIFTADIK